MLYIISRKSFDTNDIKCINYIIFLSLHMIFIFILGTTWGFPFSDANCATCAQSLQYTNRIYRTVPKYYSNWGVKKKLRRNVLAVVVTKSMRTQYWNMHGSYATYKVWMCCCTFEFKKTADFAGICGGHTQSSSVPVSVLWLSVL